MILCDAFNLIDRSKTGLITKSDVKSAWSYYFEIPIENYAIDKMFK